jgi:ribosomal protein S17E
MLTAVFEMPHYEIIIIPRYLIEKYTTMFTDEFEKEGLADSARLGRVIELSMNLWWSKYFSAIKDDFEAMQAEWDMLKIFFKWMLSGKIVEEPGLELKHVSWGVTCDALFKADIENWVRDDGMARQVPAA